MRPTRLVLVLVLVLLVLAGCSATDGEDESLATDAAEGDAGGDGMVLEELEQDAADVDAAADDAGGAGDGGGEEAADTAEGVGGGEGSLPDAPPVAPGDRVIKEGTVSVEVEAGGFDTAFAAVVAAARRHGGDVTASDTRTADDGTTSGTVTVRVPVRAYEDLVVGVGEIGTVRGRSLDAQDVSAEYVDLESRLRHLEAQERFYLGLMEDAASVEDAIAVQQRLDGVQGDIEQIEGRLRHLEDRTSFSTLTVELFEVGAAPLSGTGAGVRPTFAGYWETARDAFVNVLGVLLVVAVFAAPLLAITGIAVLVWRRVTRRDGPGNARALPVDDTRDGEREDEPVGAPPA